MRKPLIIVAWIILWTIVVIAFFLAEEKLSKPPVQRGNISSVENYVVHRLNQALSQKRLGSGAVALILNGKITSEHSFGIAKIETSELVETDSTLYLLSSLSKAVTAWGIMKLVEENKIGLDEPVLPYLKRWKFPGSELHREKVTVRQLLSHTAGFVDGYGHGGFLPGEKLQSIEESLLSPNDANMGEQHAAIISNEPGISFAYSSAGYAVLQLLIEEITGRSFNKYMEEEVLKPLGMVNSGFDLDSIIAHGGEDKLATNYDLSLKSYPHRRYSNMAGVSLRSTAHDLAQLVTAYYNENPVLTKESIKQFPIPQPETSMQWGLGHTLYAENNNGSYIFGHGGGSFPASGSDMRLNLSTGNGIVLVASGTQGLISELADVWTYWETGREIFDIRTLVHKRLIYAILAILIGASVIVYLSGKKSGKSKKVAS